jgi:putative tryptophan/tyrosine transport system substrate-binding protein
MVRRTSRRSVSILLGCALPALAFGQAIQPTSVRRIGFLAGVAYTPSIAAFKAELHRLGYVEGQNLIIETHPASSGSASLAEDAAELARMDVELVVAGALPQALELRKANPAMPMVVATCPGMVNNGFAASLEHPGGIVTGIDELPPGVTAKRMRLLKTAAPDLSRIALLSTTPGHGGHETQLADAQQTAAELGVSVTAYRATSGSEVQTALAALLDDGMQGLLTFQGALSLIHRKLIIDFAVAHRLPGIYQATVFVESGGLMAWAPKLEEQNVLAAQYVDQILRGAKPGDLPVRYPPRYYLLVNTGAAGAIGLSLPPALLAQADYVLS